MGTISKEERAYRASVYEVDGIGPRRFSLLLRYFKSARSIWEASEATLGEIGLGKSIVKEFVKKRKVIEPIIHLQALAKLGIRVITNEDDEYPYLLKQIPDFPPVLFIRGMFEVEDRRAIAVVGTRKPTPYGRQVTETLVNELVGKGFTIVSGLARGIDGVAHRAAIEAGGRTIAILGGGVDRVYPPEHVGLAQQVSQHGAVVSEFASGKLPVPGNFPARNRVIAGLGLGVVVVEGASKSGTKITAGLAAELGREVFAVPGPINSRQSEAPMDLLKLGANMVSSVSDILEVLKPQLAGTVLVGSKSQKINVELDGEEKKLMDAIQNGCTQLDELVRTLGKPVSEISTLLTMLELKGVVKQVGGMVFIV